MTQQSGEAVMMAVQCVVSWREKRNVTCVSKTRPNARRPSPSSIVASFLSRYASFSQLPAVPLSSN